MQVTSKARLRFRRRSGTDLVYYLYECGVRVGGGHALIRKSKDQAGEATRGRLMLEALRGTSGVRMSTDQIMALTRGSAPRRKRRR
jgi:hypothetical protein